MKTLVAYAAAALVAFAVSPTVADTYEVQRLISQAQGEIARLRDAIVSAERELAEREDQIVRARAQGGLEKDFQRRTERLWGRLVLSSVVNDLKGDCGEMFARSPDTIDLYRALECVRDTVVAAPADEDPGCGSLKWTEHTDASIKLVGYVQSEEELSVLEDRYGAVVASGVSVRPWPICEALDTLEIPRTSEDKPVLRMLDRTTNIRFGSSLAFEAQTPSFPAFMYIAFLQADGSVVNLTPRLAPLRQQHRPQSTLIFGDGQRGRRTFTAAPPAGTEAIVAIASRSPIDGLEALETTRDGQYWRDRAAGDLIDRGLYLELLAESLKDMPNERLGGRELTADILYLNIIP